MLQHSTHSSNPYQNTVRRGRNMCADYVQILHHNSLSGPGIPIWWKALNLTKFNDWRYNSQYFTAEPFMKNKWSIISYNTVWQCFYSALVRPELCHKNWGKSDQQMNELVLSINEYMNEWMTCSGKWVCNDWQWISSMVLEYLHIIHCNAMLRSLHDKVTHKVVWTRKGNIRCRTDFQVIKTNCIIPSQLPSFYS